MTKRFYKLTAWALSIAMIFTFAITASATDKVEEISGESPENTYSTISEAQPKIMEITFNSESPAYNAETNTFAVAADKPFVAYLTVDNFDYIDEDFLKNITFGFVPSVDNSENALGASLFELGDFVSVDPDKNSITLTFDYDTLKEFLAEYEKFEGVCFGNNETIKEEDIKAVNIVLEKTDTNKFDTDSHNCPAEEFDDLDITAWYHLDTDYVIENGIFKGVTENTFAPDDKLTRAMLVTVLYRLEGEPKVSGITSFADLEKGQYYLDAVCWAQLNVIINGITDTEFAPNSNITREQIATIMYRYAQYKGIDVSVGENTNILSYDDFDSISEYATASMQWTVGSGLMKGKTQSTLAPKDFATRAEIAAILHRFIETSK